MKNFKFFLTGEGIVMNWQFKRQSFFLFNKLSKLCDSDDLLDCLKPLKLNNG